MITEAPTITDSKGNRVKVGDILKAQAGFYAVVAVHKDDSDSLTPYHVYMFHGGTPEEAEKYTHVWEAFMAHWPNIPADWFRLEHIVRARSPTPDRMVPAEVWKEDITMMAGAKPRFEIGTAVEIVETLGSDPRLIGKEGIVRKFEEAATTPFIYTLEIDGELTYGFAESWLKPISDITMSAGMKHYVLNWGPPLEDEISRPSKKLLKKHLLSTIDGTVDVSEAFEKFFDKGEYKSILGEHVQVYECDCAEPWSHNEDGMPYSTPKEWQSQDITMQSTLDTYSIARDCIDMETGDFADNPRDYAENMNLNADELKVVENMDMSFTEEDILAIKESIDGRPMDTDERDAGIEAAQEIVFSKIRAEIDIFNQAQRETLKQVKDVTMMAGKKFKIGDRVAVSRAGIKQAESTKDTESTKDIMWIMWLRMLYKNKSVGIVTETIDNNTAVMAKFRELDGNRTIGIPISMIEPAPGVEDVTMQAPPLFKPGNRVRINMDTYPFPAIGPGREGVMATYKNVVFTINDAVKLVAGDGRQKWYYHMAERIDREYREDWLVLEDTNDVTMHGEMFRTGDKVRITKKGIAWMETHSIPGDGPRSPMNTTSRKTLYR